MHSGRQRARGDTPRHAGRGLFTRQTTTLRRRQIIPQRQQKRRPVIWRQHFVARPTTRADIYLRFFHTGYGGAARHGTARPGHACRFHTGRGPVTALPKTSSSLIWFLGFLGFHPKAHGKHPILSYTTSLSFFSRTTAWTTASITLTGYETETERQHLYL